MQWWEVNRYLKGLHRRYHTDWETTRALQWWLACMFSDSKKHTPPQTPRDMYQFGWEEEQTEQAQAPSEEDIAEMQELMRNNMI